ncbi:hypothetical protein WJX82_003784 [Trebouxia sp. C0006]
MQERLLIGLSLATHSDPEETGPRAEERVEEEVEMLEGVMKVEVRQAVDWVVRVEEEMGVVMEGDVVVRGVESWVVVGEGVRAVEGKENWVEVDGVVGLAGVGKAALEVVKLVGAENEVEVEAVGWVGVESGAVGVVVRQVLEVGDLVGEEVRMNEVAGAVGVKDLVVGVKVGVMEGVMEGVMGVEMGVETVGVGMEEVVVRGTSRRSAQTPDAVRGAGAAAVPGELEPVTGAELGLVEDPGEPEIGNGTGETCDDMLGDAVPFVGTAGVAVSPGDRAGVDGTLGDAPVVGAGVAVSPGDGEGVDGTLGDAPVVGAGEAVSPGDEEGVDGTLGDAPVAKAGEAASPGNITGDVLGAAVTPGKDVDAGEGDSGTLGETPGGEPDGDVASGDDSGEVSGSGGVVAVEVVGVALGGVVTPVGVVGDAVGDVTDAGGGLEVVLAGEG